MIAMFAFAENFYTEMVPAIGGWLNAGDGEDK